ncbi:transposase [Microcoleus anatoxicus]
MAYLWTPSYLVSTAGNICTERVKRYIEDQIE